MSCRVMVLPAFGGDWISARCPLPIGMMRSITRVVNRSRVVSKRNRPFGYSGVSLVKSGRVFGGFDVLGVDRVHPDQRAALLPWVATAFTVAHYSGCASDRVATS